MATECCIVAYIYIVRLQESGECSDKCITVKMEEEHAHRIPSGP